MTVLCLLLAGALLYVWTLQKPDEELQPVQPLTQSYTPNEGERVLKDSLGLAGGRLTLPDTLHGKNIILGDTLFVRQDTLRINGNGVVLQSDTTYQGAALVAAINNKLLMLENITFRNFRTAIVVQGSGLLLRNVRFENCGLPVQRNHYLSGDSTLTGAFLDTFRVIRSIPQ